MSSLTIDKHHILIAMTQEMIRYGYINTYKFFKIATKSDAHQFLWQSLKQEQKRSNRFLSVELIIGNIFIFYQLEWEFLSAEFYFCWAFGA
jgi:hypothetical protein